MPAPEPTLDVVREWLVKADHDLLNATHTLKLGAACPTDTVCFHVQQCVEKHIKALLVFQSIPFPKIHNIHVLRALLPAKLRPKLDKKTEIRLTKYATVTRYPESGPEITLTEARKAVATARRVRREIRKHLPKTAR